MGRIVIVAYKPIPGKEAELKELMKTHVPRLRLEGLATDREPVLMESEDGTVLEVLEWVSDEAIRTAHTSPAVQEMWREYALVCTYTPLSQVAETANLFAEFTPLN